MPLNRATLIRISTIDRCLQDHYRRWTIDDLIDACTEALAEFEGRSNPVSRRTFQNDLALMRSDRLGYNAPIVVRIDADQAPYVESKPYHRSQVVERRYSDGSILISLKVVLNRELERLLLGFGHHVEVIAPPALRQKVAKSITIAAGHYTKKKITERRRVPKLFRSAQNGCAAAF